MLLVKAYHCRPPTETSHIILYANSDGYFNVTSIIYDKGSIRFLVDTGATMGTISNDEAKRLIYNPPSGGEPIIIITANGTSAVYKTRPYTNRKYHFNQRRCNNCQRQQAGFRTTVHDLSEYDDRKTEWLDHDSDKTFSVISTCPQPSPTVDNSMYGKNPSTSQIRIACLFVAMVSVFRNPICKKPR